MRTIVYMAASVNGYVAKEGDDTSFVPDTDWQLFIAMAQEKGNIIVGRRTYEQILKDKDFAKFAKVKMIVVSGDRNIKAGDASVQIVTSPQEALEYAKQQGFSDALVAGGGSLNASFMAAGLLDEIYVDIEPAVIGKGTRLFAEGDFDARLKLLGVKKISPDEVQLHYEVIKESG